MFAPFPKDSVTGVSEDSIFSVLCLFERMVRTSNDRVVFLIVFKMPPELLFCFFILGRAPDVGG